VISGERKGGYLWEPIGWYEKNILAPTTVVSKYPPQLDQYYTSNIPFTKLISKVPGVKDKNLVVSLHKIDHHIPAESTRTSNDKRLGILGQKNLAKKFNRLAKDGNKQRVNVRCGRGAHGVQNILMEFDGTYRKRRG
jgi:hypothetical protein